MPAGTGPTGGGDPRTVQNANYYAKIIRGNFGNAAAMQYLALYQKYQNQIAPRPDASTAYIIFDAFFIDLVAGHTVADATKAVANAVANVSQTTATSLPTGLTGINAIGDFFARLEEPNTWKRVGEFLAGGILLYIGGRALIQNTPAAKPVQDVTRVAKKVVK